MSCEILLIHFAACGSKELIPRHSAGEGSTYLGQITFESQMLIELAEENHKRSWSALKVLTGRKLSSLHRSREQ